MIKLLFAKLLLQRCSCFEKENKNRRELIKIDPIAFMKKITKSLKLIILGFYFFVLTKKYVLLFYFSDNCVKNLRM